MNRYTLPTLLLTALTCPLAAQHDWVMGPPSAIGGSIFSAGTSTIQVVAGLSNIGTATAPSGLVEFWLSTDMTLQPNTDILISTVNSVPLFPGSSGSVISFATIPFYTTPGLYFLGASIDRAGVTGDVNPNNNTVFSAPISVTAPGCASVLEISQPQGANNFLTTVSGAQGANVQMRLTRPCSAGDLYVVTGSITGTTPGFPLFGCNVPLNFDSMTSTILNNLNISPFVNFSATSTGADTATLVFPAGTPVFQPFILNLAAVYLSGATCTAVTNPISIIVNP